MKTENNTSFISFVALFGFVMAGFFFAQFLGLLFAFPFVGLEANIFDILAGDFKSQPEYRPAILAYQAGNSFALFIAAPLAYMWYYERQPLGSLFQNHTSNSEQWLSAGLTLLIVLAYLPFSGFLVSVNEGMSLPPFLEELELALQSAEERAREITTYLVDFDSFGQYLMGLFVVAAIPGVGEELLFRGVLQRKIYDYAGNQHLAIWISAILFSAFHLQFYGFLPRMALGALFGYLYIWSGSLLFPMLAHFINNGLTLTVMYAYTDLSLVEEPGGSTDISWDKALLSLAFTSLIAFYFHRINRKK